MLDPVEQGRESYRHRAWAGAYQSLSAADRATPLGAEDLELLARSAYLIGRDDEFQRSLERAYRRHLEAAATIRAARCAFWLGLRLLLRGELGQATGWLVRCRRLLEDRDCVEQGYLLLPAAEQQLGGGNVAAAQATALAAVEIGARFGDMDLLACARHVQGRALIRQGEVRPGLALLDEAMLTVVAGEVSPIMTGMIYCSVIEACQEVYALSRAREWTSAFARWCEQQPELVAFTAPCLVRRSEILQLQGAWPDALAEAHKACKRSEGEPPGAAFYQQGEVHRLRGQFATAEREYRSASRLGWEPQPGLALLRLAQGRTDTAGAAIRRVLGAATDPWQRARLLPAYVEIMLAAGDIEAGRTGTRELGEIAEGFDTEVLRAMAAHAQGAVHLAESEARAALGPLRLAFDLWHKLEAPCEEARVRVLLGLACRALGDDEAAALEQAAARAVFEQLGAVPDLARLDGLAGRGKSLPGHPLTPRELQVLRMVAEGRTNKAIATALRVSERTIDRHMSNILGKLDVPSRAAATAYACDHQLL